MGGGWGLSKVAVTFNHVGGFFKFFNYHHRGCANNPIFSNLGLCVICWASFVCLLELWPASVTDPYPSLNSSFGIAERKHYRKITIPTFRRVLQNFALPGCFPCILSYRYILSLRFSGWFVIAVCDYILVMELVKWLVWHVNCCSYDYTACMDYMDLDIHR